MARFEIVAAKVGVTVRTVKRRIRIAKAEEFSRPVRRGRRSGPHLAAGAGCHRSDPAGVPLASPLRGLTVGPTKGLPVGPTKGLRNPSPSPPRKRGGACSLS